MNKNQTQFVKDYTESNGKDVSVEAFMKGMQEGLNQISNSNHPDITKEKALEDAQDIQAEASAGQEE